MTDSNQLMQSALLKQLAPFTLSGYALFREVIDSDGALPAKLKCLFSAVAATNKGYLELARRELERAALLGVLVNEAASGLILLSSLRGEGAALAFNALLAEVYGLPASAAQPSLVRAGPGEAETAYRRIVMAQPTRTRTDRTTHPMSAPYQVG